MKRRTDERNSGPGVRQLTDHSTPYFSRRWSLGVDGVEPVPPDFPGKYRGFPLRRDSFEGRAELLGSANHLLARQAAAGKQQLPKDVISNRTDGSKRGQRNVV